MSSLYRSAISARIAKLPQLPPTDEDNVEQSELADEIGALSTGMGPPPVYAPPNPQFQPLSSAAYFSQALQVALPTRALDVRVYFTPPKYDGGGVIVLHHGAGYAGTSFACLAKEISGIMKDDVGVLAFDARRHGKTTSSQSDENLSIDVLVDDFCALIQAIYLDAAAAPTLMLVGHSMGGSVCVRACPILQQHKYKIAGVAVLDVVEGTAVEALPHMHTILNSRPEGFDSIEEAIEWHVDTGLIHNPTSARVSIPSIIVPADSPLTPTTRTNSGFKYKWRTPLRSTAPYWDSWFPSLSSLFLALRSARLLVLAGAERLDTTLMVGQMQGKFWLEVMAGSGVGHLVHEDDPTRLAEILSDFWKRNERVVVRGNVIKGVGEV
ncbi:protein phosphatase methylesterase [Rhizopogon vinicolor AM-OR11-026]|uniref:Protein phosphatase methylesterase 1 n=1 Tax=Rhizopogon vinicolor AM-OR11-026 TaxID=1314800 RepID=A0A1B7NAW9_9AGAM|nr:protein phosphatase methylesterase [Rhizopogon vinicolor AM-OR11-026]